MPWLGPNNPDLAATIVVAFLLREVKGHTLFPAADLRGRTRI